MTSRLREGVLWLGAVAGLLSMVAAVAVTFFGFSFLIFRSGSMGPEISTGSLALARTTPAAEIRSGDVVSVVASSGERITHRVVTSTLRGDGAALVLQGDANASADEEIYLVTEAEREIASVPFVGYAVSVLLTPAGLVAGGCLAAMLLLVGFGTGKDDAPRAPSRDSGRHRGGSARGFRRSSRVVGAGVAIVATAAVGSAVMSTSAFFTDQATRTSGQFAAGSLSAPVLKCVEGNGATVTISFPAAGPTSVTYSAGLDSNGENLTVAGSGSSRTVEINQAQAPGGNPFFFGTSVTYTVTVTAATPHGSWSETSQTRIRSSRAGFFSGTTDITCL